MSLSATAAASRAPVIPLITELKLNELRQASIVATVNIGTINAPVHEKRKVQVPLADELNIELILRTIEEFHDVAGAGRLNLSTGPKKFEKFRECLRGTIRDQWDIARATQATETNDTFRLAIAEFVKKFLRESDVPKQKLYMDTAPKPFKLSVRELAARYRFLNRLMKWFPGANDTEPYSELELKYLLHMAMLQEWKDHFGRSNLSVVTSSYEDITNYFAEQEEIHNRIRERNNARGGGGRGGRGRAQQGYQGRGFGRGYRDGNYYNQGRGYYNHQGRGYYNQGSQAAPGAAVQGGYTPQAQYRRLNTPPSRVSTGSSASPGRYQGRGGFAGRGRFQPVRVQQAAHYVDDSSSYGQDVHHSHSEPQTHPGDQDNYLAESNDPQDYQEEVNEDTYFQEGYDEDEEYYADGQW